MKSVRLTEHVVQQANSRSRPLRVVVVQSGAIADFDENGALAALNEVEVSCHHKTLALDLNENV